MSCEENEVIKKKRIGWLRRCERFSHIICRHIRKNDTFDKNRIKYFFEGVKYLTKVESIKFTTFMNRDYKKPNKVVEHVKNHKVIYSIAGYTLVIVGIPHLSLAATPGIDVGAKKIYYQLCNIGKWIIICKGGWETINSAVKSDFESAKRHFLSYLLIYVILLAFPYGMDKVDEMFKGIGGGQ